MRRDWTDPDMIRCVFEQLSHGLNSLGNIPFSALADTMFRFDQEDGKRGWMSADHAMIELQRSLFEYVTAWERWKAERQRMIEAM